VGGRRLFGGKAPPIIGVLENPCVGLVARQWTFFVFGFLFEAGAELGREGYKSAQLTLLGTLVAFEIDISMGFSFCYPSANRLLTGSSSAEKQSKYAVRCCRRHPSNKNRVICVRSSSRKWLIKLELQLTASSSLSNFTHMAGQPSRPAQPVSCAFSLLCSGPFRL
jgi:hypothetical protein